MNPQILDAVQVSLSVFGVSSLFTRPTGVTLDPADDMTFFSAHRAPAECGGCVVGLRRRCKDPI